MSDDPFFDSLPSYDPRRLKPKPINIYRSLVQDFPPHKEDAAAIITLATVLQECLHDLTAALDNIVAVGIENEAQ